MMASTLCASRYPLSRPTDDGRHVLALLCPGQGSQSPGMLSAWLELPGATEFVGQAGEAIGLDLLRLGTTAGTDEITDTAVTQPLIVTAGLLAGRELPLAGADSLVLAGHSVGEITAASLAGVLGTDAALGFAARRGAAMAAACAATPTGMSAVLGGEADEVVAALSALGLVPANRNGAGQIVAAGSREALAALADDPPPGARVRPLAVAGAFHTHYMGPAEDALADYAQGLTSRNPGHILLSNADGTALSTGHGVLGRLIRQVTRPVRWDLCTATMRDLGVGIVVELPPAGTLVGLAKRDLPDAERIAVRTPEDLEAARAALADAGHHGQGDHVPDFRIVVSPVKGTFTREAEVDEGAAVHPGARLGVVRTNRDEFPVVVPAEGVLTEWLRHDGDIVAAGLPLARLAAPESVLEETV